MADLEIALSYARALDVEAIARSIQRLGLACTRCGTCCRGAGSAESHATTVFPDEIERIRSDDAGEWRDVARPIPYGLSADGTGETFEWALQMDTCGDCRSLEETDDGNATCGVYEDRPRICRTYPFQVALPGVSEPSANAVATDGLVEAYECEGLGRPIGRADALRLSGEIKHRAVREIEEAQQSLERYRPAEATNRTVVHDSEGAKTPDGKPLPPRSDGGFEPTSRPPT